MSSEPRVVRRSLVGTLLLRAALVCGVFIVVLVLVSMRPMPGVADWLFDLIQTLSTLALLLGVIAPLLAIVGAILAFRAQRRLSALDWVSFAFGLVSVLLPALFIYAYSDCPGGVC